MNRVRYPGGLEAENGVLSSACHSGPVRERDDRLASGQTVIISWGGSEEGITALPLPEFKLDGLTILLTA